MGTGGRGGAMGGPRGSTSTDPARCRVMDEDTFGNLKMSRQFMLGDRGGDVAVMKKIGR